MTLDEQVKIFAETITGTLGDKLEDKELTQKERRALWDAWQDKIYDMLIDGEQVIIPGGYLKVETRNARTGRNPQTGESIEIPARKVVKVKISAKRLKEMYNK